MSHLYRGKLFEACLGRSLNADATIHSTGSIKERAHTLHHALTENPALKDQDLNFLAHSMVRENGCAPT
jgi:hypothetical protein